MKVYVKAGSDEIVYTTASGRGKIEKVNFSWGARYDALYLESVELRQQLYEKQKTVSAAHALATACYNAAAFLDDRELIRKAYELWDELSVKHPEYAGYRDRAGKYL